MWKDVSSKGDSTNNFITGFVATITITRITSFALFLKREMTQDNRETKRKVVVTYRLRKQYKPRDDLFLHQTAYLYSKIWNTRNTLSY